VLNYRYPFWYVATYQKGYKLMLLGRNDWDELAVGVMHRAGSVSRGSDYVISNAWLGSRGVDVKMGRNTRYRTLHILTVSLLVCSSIT